MRTGQADVVLLARELLRDPIGRCTPRASWARRSTWPAQYLRAGPHGAKPRVRAIAAADSDVASR